MSRLELEQQFRPMSNARKAFARSRMQPQILRDEQQGFPRPASGAADPPARKTTAKKKGGTKTTAEATPRTKSPAKR